RETGKREDNRSDGLNWYHRYSVKFAGIDSFLGRAGENETETAQAFSNENRQLFKGVSVTATETDTSQASQSFTKRISDRHGRQHWPRRKIEIRSPTNAEVEDGDEPRQRDNQHKDGARNSKCMTLPFHDAGDNFRTQQRN